MEDNVQDTCITEEELMDIVTCLNEDIYEHFDTDYDGEIYCEYRTIGNASCIEFLGMQIWCSENEGYEVAGEDILNSANALLDKVKSLPSFKYSE